MPLTIEEYDRKVGHHIRMLRHHGEQMVSHAERMVFQPGFETLAEGELMNVCDGLANALATAKKTLANFRSKPRDE